MSKAHLDCPRKEDCTDASTSVNVQTQNDVPDEDLGARILSGTYAPRRVQNEDDVGEMSARCNTALGL